MSRLVFLFIFISTFGFGQSMPKFADSIRLVYGIP